MKNRFARQKALYVLITNHLVLFCMLLTGLSVRAQTRLSQFFSDRMVLQQQADVAIWGMDKPSTKVRVLGSWGKEAVVKVDSIGRWRVQLPTPAAGGPFTIQVNGSSKILLQDVMIGEVWLCAGQSNMEMPVRGNINQPINGSNQAILHSANNQIRFFKATRSVSVTPEWDTKGVWVAANPGTTGDFSATAYFFARELQQILNIPIGIIQTAWGASTIESWMDSASLTGFTGNVIPRAVPEKDPNRTPTIMFNSMLHPFAGYTLRGFTWYQGEANRPNASSYQALMTKMIDSWRKHWGNDQLPFYFVQIAPFEPGEWNSAFVREAQLKTMQSVPNTGMVVTMDIGERTVIHPAEKETIGKRLALWALAKDYQVKGIAFSGPVYKSAEFLANGRVQLSFDYAGMGLTSFGKPLAGFEIAGADKVFYPAEALIDKDKAGRLLVWSKLVEKPVSVRYAFKSWAEASLYNTQGLPASSFRTDDW